MGPARNQWADSQQQQMVVGFEREGESVRERYQGVEEPNKHQDPVNHLLLSAHLFPTIQEEQQPLSLL